MRFRFGVLLVAAVALSGCSAEEPKKEQVKSRRTSPMVDSAGRGGARAGERSVRVVDSPVIGIWTRMDGSNKATLTVDEGNTYELVDESNPEASHKGTYLFMGKRLSLRPTDVGEPGRQEKASGQFINFRVGKDQKTLESADPGWVAKFKKR